MPIKHQTDSYRNRNGVRYECDGDICDGVMSDLRNQAQVRVKELRTSGRKAFFEVQDACFYRVFVEAV